MDASGSAGSSTPRGNAYSRTLRELTALHHAAAGKTDKGVAKELGISRLRGARPPLRRQFLHAQRLAFRHPRTGERIEVEAPLAGDLERALTELGRRRAGQEEEQNYS